ncbi:uncharacterized protein K452DRAFT_297485 [Aplosporella prunicola CBS 121167]|uniref:DNA repair protein Swi5/Sae3 n=1 Tax=Aplosporella prunicola CBS 121167 TaxID=1176127 RepID=A0A6A6BFN4_9PEZI|nr:uncharacterized protein K452DRAFT_297485 [Aplosporella prunicola CBS 121167]KAF2142970.1 hypothetical protein K452DRAFT_297485 [Aplosporella prunicola CBS 121167]
MQHNDRDDDARLRTAKQRTAALEAQLADLTAHRDDLLQKLTTIPSVAATLPQSDASTSTPAAEAGIQAAKDIIKEHIRLLHDYNEIRDVGQGLMGIIAESRGVRIKEVQDEFGMTPKD